MASRLIWTTGLILFLFFGSGPVQALDLSPIRIGATISTEGSYKEPSLMIQKAFRLWVDEVNQKGGLLGRKVQLILYDDRSREDLARTLYTKLIEQDRVDLLFSPYSTPLTLAASTVSEAHQMLMLAVAAAAEKPWQRGARYLFQIYAPAKRQLIGVLDMMARKNLKTLSLICDETSDFNIELNRGVIEWARTFQMEILYEKAFRNGKKELPSILAQVRKKAAAGLILSAYPPDAYELIRLLQEMNYRPPVLAMPIAPAHPDFHKRAGAMADLVFGPSQWEPDKRIPFPGTRDFVEGFTRFTGHPPSFHATSAYSACQLYEQAVVKTRSLDNRKLRDYIAALDTVTVLGRFKVDPSGLQVGHNSFIIQWQNGEKEIVWPRKMQTAPPIL